MRFKLISVNNIPVCKNSYYNGKYYNYDLGIIRSNCNNIEYIKNYTINVKIAFENMYKWLHNAQVNSNDNFDNYVMGYLHELKNYLENNKKYIIVKNKKYYNIYFLINAKEYNQKTKIIYKYGIPTVSVKKGYNCV